MHILLITNDLYVPHVAATLASVFENNMDMKFDVHILATDVSDESTRKLRLFIEEYGNTLDLRNVNPVDLDIDLSVCGKWGIFPSMKLYSADFFPNVDKLLYLDADMICVGSLKYLDELEISNYYVAASTDEELASVHKERLNIPQEEFYCCAGLMLFNLDAWRRDNVRSQCFDFFNNPNNRDIIKFGEQDVINKVCMGHILELPIEYNMFSFYWLHHGRTVPGRYRSTIEEHKRNAVIIHYIDACKPWFRDCRFPLKSYYHKYAAMTPWGDQNWGCSPMYEGGWQNFKNSIKCFLHHRGIKEYDFAYDV